MVSFRFLLPFYMQQLAVYLEEELSFSLIHSFVGSFVCSFVHSFVSVSFRGFLLYSINYNLDVQAAPGLVSESPLELVLDVSPSVFEHVLLSDTISCSRPTLSFPCSGPAISLLPFNEEHHTEGLCARE